MGVTPIYSIPFAEPTDLVRDWPELSEDVADAVEAAIAGVPVLAGIGSNTVQTIKTDTYTMNSTTFENITGYTATITPTSATSKVLVIAQMACSTAGTGSNLASTTLRLTGGNTSAYRGAADGSRQQGSTGFSGVTTEYDLRYSYENVTLVYLDSPNTTDPVTYGVEVARFNSNAFFLNRTSSADGDSANVTRAASSLTVIEVAA